MNIKKTIAREGLIILGVLAMFLLSSLWNKVAFLIYPSILAYPLYLLIRFIIWAVRTLREK